MPQVRVVARNLMDMLAALPTVKLDKLYESSFTCVAVLRKKETRYKMNPKFQSNVQKYLVHGETLPREPMSSSVTGRLPSLEELEAYALEQWERVLLQLISSAQAERLTNFSSSMLRVVQRVLLSSRENEAVTLIKNGFQFLLMETNTQLWYIVGEYISSSEDCGVDPTDLISFLLELSFHTMGKAYNLSTLTDVQRNAIKDLASLGLVKLQQGRKESWFIPTKLATTLSVSLSDTSARKQGYVVVETNFKIYAYSTSKLHYEILRLFSRIECQLPNLIAGCITKESLDNAFEKGITSEQIISFLQQNAHPLVAEKTPAVPENVTDLIRLWEANRNRVGITPSHLYEDFPFKDVFVVACDFARELDGLLWEDSKKMRLIVNEELQQDMRGFLRHQK